MDIYRESSLPRLTHSYLEYLQHFNTGKLLEDVAQCYTPSTVLRLACALQVETRRAVALVLGFIGTYDANSALGKMLRDPDRSVRLLAENSIKNVWPRDGSETQRHMLRQIMRNVNSLQFDEAVRLANILLEECPLYAEARNQRAIALFAMGDFQNAIEDGNIVLDLNPYHFGAAIGLGHAYKKLNDTESAVFYFQKALEINPNLESIRRHIERMVK